MQKLSNHLDRERNITPMYGKIFESTFTGSMVGSGATVFAVWAYVIANTRNSRVELNPRLLSLIIGTKMDEVQRAIEVLCAPDPESRSKDHEGRRLIREGEFQYFVPNYETYRGMRDDEDRREYNRIAQQRSRNNRKNQENPTGQLSIGLSATVSHGQPRSAQSEAEAETKKTEVELVFEHWQRTFNKPKARLDPKRHKVIKQALTLFPMADLQKALSGYLKSDFHMGKNDRNKQFVDIELLLRDSKHIEEGLAKVSNGEERPGWYRDDA